MLYFILLYFHHFFRFVLSFLFVFPAHLPSYMWLSNHPTPSHPKPVRPCLPGEGEQGARAHGAEATGRAVQGVHGLGLLLLQHDLRPHQHRPEAGRLRQVRLAPLETGELAVNIIHRHTHVHMHTLNKRNTHFWIRSFVLLLNLKMMFFSFYSNSLPGRWSFFLEQTHDSGAHWPPGNVFFRTKKQTSTHDSLLFLSNECSKASREKRLSSQFGDVCYFKMFS